MACLVVKPHCSPGAGSSLLPAVLSKCMLIFIQTDGHHSSLQCPYCGPFQLVSVGDKTAFVDNRLMELISIDHLKMAHVPSTDCFPVADSKALHTGSGYTVECPACYL